MPTLFPHQALQNYFVEVDLLAPGASEAVADLYEAGKVILLKNAHIEHDAAFLAELALPTGERFKKFKSARFAENPRADPAIYEELLERTFRRDRRRVDQFVAEVNHVNRQVMALCQRLFPRYRYITRPITWRLTDTVNENTHVDVYKQDLPDHHLRLFINIDTIPRIWHTSWTLEDMLARYLGRLDPEFIVSATPGRICHDLNFAVFGGFERAGRDGHPKHIAFFDPGDVWIVDSRKVSHQIFYGRRAISTDFAVEVSSMNDPAQHYLAIVERHRRAVPR